MLTFLINSSITVAFLLQFWFTNILFSLCNYLIEMFNSGQVRMVFLQLGSPGLTYSQCSKENQSNALISSFMSCFQLPSQMCNNRICTVGQREKKTTDSMMKKYDEKLGVTPLDIFPRLKTTWLHNNGINGEGNGSIC